MALRWLLLAAASALAVPGTAAALTLDDCDAKVRRSPGDPGSYYCYVQAAHATGRLEEAAERLEEILAIRPDLHRARLDLAVLEHDMGLERAAATYRAAIAGMKGTGDAWGLVYAHSGLAAFFDARRRFREAEPHHAQALQVAEAAGDPLMVAHARTRAAIHADGLLDYGKALRLFREAEAAVFPDGPAYLKDWILSGLGRIHWALGRHGKALSIYRRGAELNRRTGNLHAEAAMRYNVALLAGILWEGGGMDHQRLTRLIREAIEAAGKGGNRTVEASARLMMAEITGGDPARDQILEALRILEPQGPSEDLLLARRLLAEWTFLQGPDHHEEAIRMAVSTVEQAAASGDRWSKARGLILRAGMLTVAGRDRERVISAHLEALEAVERIRELQPESSIRARSFGQWAFAYHRLVAFLLGGAGSSPQPRADLDLAFRTLERARSRTLLETLNAAGVTPAREASPDTVLRRETLERIAEMQKELLEPDLPAARRGELLERLERLESREVSLRDRMARAGPSPAGHGPAEAPGLSTLQSLLGPGQAMVLYVLREDPLDRLDPMLLEHGGSWALAISSQEALPFEIPGLRQIRDQTLAYRGLLERRDGTERAAARRLYDDLLAGAVAALPGEITRLIIVPGAVLGTLPFGTLRLPPGRLVAERFEIFYAPSATLWTRWRARPAWRAGFGVLGVADPAAGRREGQSSRRLSDPWMEGLHLGPLPHAAREAASMVRRLGGDALFLEGPRAGESALKSEELSRYDVIHVAAHAVVDDGHPERSAIVLAEDAEGEDGLLQFREIVDMELDDKLVLLTACRSAGGEDIPGEGVMSLARAFFEAGARTLVGSLLPLRDDETARLMDELSRGLARGGSVAGALASARREMIAEGMPPAAWAGLVVLGDGDLVPRPQARILGVPVPAGAAFVLGLAGLLLLGRRFWRRRAV